MFITLPGWSVSDCTRASPLTVAAPARLMLRLVAMLSRNVLEYSAEVRLRSPPAVMTSDVPAPVAFLIICTEFFGGIGLIVGLLTRIAALGIAVEMIGAIFLVHLPNGFFMNWYGNQKGEGFEYHLLTIAVAATLLLRGSGPFSADRALSQ